MTAPTGTAGTPHEHTYLWIEDPANQVMVDQITPALEKHVKYCENAESEDHPWDSNADEGAIIIHHSPPLVEWPAFRPEPQATRLPPSSRLCPKNRP